ncbi:hypothetical protein HRR83_002162 [Exophiala dermatitidis]|uniref:Uncharacterized protein n=1 Tax=Exophiala dermatitidis TaxID=5970 RepID=A0AAN6IVZ9_EXODE|nr:hypothetical protein HRR74_002239 [Exophiala dermatitidis]KAJ4525685.1 hypothetical protein HRR73_002417 [Exophiala dermatitidis]KAJ4537009.1 hypothetical protein HRR76_005029 [Exophiala dermatitidis]KAJ4555393.1 hypothetical protein HRR77_001326 [Exophiala dermatitidis]KAJ4572293.1 hypothetical protein HRR79_003494 [Exophiala dermatitidis]
MSGIITVELAHIGASSDQSDMELLDGFAQDTLHPVIQPLQVQNLWSCAGQPTNTESKLWLGRIRTRGKSRQRQCRVSSGAYIRHGACISSPKNGPRTRKGQARNPLVADDIADQGKPVV